MIRRKPQTIEYRRKRQQDTDYRKRLRLLLSRQPRLVVRFTNTRILAQVVRFQPQGDQIMAATDSSVLRKMGWTYSCKNTPATYLTGFLIAKKALKAKVSRAILDTGLRTPLIRGRTYAFLKGALDAGLDIPYGDNDTFPKEERLRGKHVAEHLKVPAEQISSLIDKIKKLN